MTRSENDILQDDLGDMLRVLGMFDGARPQSPHEVFRECIDEVKRLKEKEVPSTIRESIGLESASMGRPEGVGRFLDFVRSEFYIISVLSNQPEPVAERVQILARQVEGVREFVSGFVASQETKKK